MRTLFAVVALAFFCAPIGLRMVGVHAAPFENRRLAELPRLDAGWDAFDQATRFFVDRLPLREQAVRANSWISLNVFDRTPDYGRSAAGGNAIRDALPFGEPEDAEKPTAPARTQPGTGQAAVEVQPGVTVLRGRDGWLFLEEELVRACQRFIDWPTAVRRYDRLVSIIRASGRRVVFAIPPDKSTIYPEYLPSTYAEKDCAPQGRAEVWKEIEGARRPELLGLREAMLAEKAPPPEQTYLVNDTHWGSKGAVLALRAVLKRLGGRAQVRDGDIVRGREEVSGDLSNLIGAPKAVDSPSWSISRPVAPASPGQETLPSGAVLDTASRPAGGAPLIPGRTLFVYDSYGVRMLPNLSAYTRRLESVLWVKVQPNSLQEAIERADTVILEKVERDVNYFASDQGYFTPAFLSALSARLRAAPGRR